MVRIEHFVLLLSYFLIILRELPFIMVWVLDKNAYSAVVIQRPPVINISTQRGTHIGPTLVWELLHYYMSFSDAEVSWLWAKMQHHAIILQNMQSKQMLAIQSKIKTSFWKCLLYFYFFIFFHDTGPVTLPVTGRYKKSSKLASSLLGKHVIHTSLLKQCILKESRVVCSGTLS